MDLLMLPRAAAATALGLGTALRGARVFHPQGSAFAATVDVDGDGDGTWGARLLDVPARHDGLVRVSRAAGLPAPLPDVVGLAIRVPGLGKDERPLDVLVNSAGGPPGLRHVFLPQPLARTFSSVLPYRTATGRRIMLGARSDGDGSWELLAAPVLGEWVRWGRLTLGAPLPDELSRELRFLPTLGAYDLQPVELFRTLRDWSYRQSQSHRP